jgi:sec-independent protein translocase protein TatA
MTAFLLYFAFLGTTEWILIVVAIVLLFGGKKIPELMGGLGKGIKEFKKATQDDDVPETKSENKKEEN